jgi:hypothetical protein
VVCPQAPGADDRCETIEISGVLGLGGHRGHGLGQEALRGALVHERPVVDDDKPVTHLLELAENVGGHEHGAASGPHLGDQPAHLSDARGVEAVAGLVQHKELRVAQQGGGDPEPLLHAERVGAEAIAAAGAQAHRVQHEGDAGRVVAAKRREHAQVLDPGQPGPQRRAFDERAHAAQVTGRVVQGATEHRASADGRGHQPKEHGHRRGLAGSVGADEAGNHPARYVQREPVDRHPVAEALAQAVHRDRGRGHALTVPHRWRHVVRSGATSHVRTRS